MSKAFKESYHIEHVQQLEGSSNSGSGVFDSHRSTSVNHSLSQWRQRLRADVQYDGAIMVTASHLPFNRNGFKFFDNKAGFEKGEVGDLLRRAAEDAGNGGGLQEDPAFPADKRQAEEGELARLESSLSILPSLVSKAGSPPPPPPLEQIHQSKEGHQGRLSPLH